MSKLTIKDCMGFADIEIICGKDLKQDNYTYIKWSKSADIQLDVCIRLENYNELIKATSKLLQKQKFLQKALDEYNEKE